MRRFFSIIAIFALMSTSFAVNPLKIFVTRSKTVKGDYVDVESLKVNHAYIETLDAHSPIHVVAPFVFTSDNSFPEPVYRSWWVFCSHDYDTLPLADTLSDVSAGLLYKYTVKDNAPPFLVWFNGDITDPRKFFNDYAFKDTIPDTLGEDLLMGLVGFVENHIWTYCDTFAPGLVYFRHVEKVYIETEDTVDFNTDKIFDTKSECPTITTFDSIICPSAGDTIFVYGKTCKTSNHIYPSYNYRRFQSAASYDCYNFTTQVDTILASNYSLGDTIRILYCAKGDTTTVYDSFTVVVKWDCKKSSNTFLVICDCSDYAVYDSAVFYSTDGSTFHVLSDSIFDSLAVAPVIQDGGIYGFRGIWETSSKDNYNTFSCFSSYNVAQFYESFWSDTFLSRYYCIPSLGMDTLKSLYANGIYSNTEIQKYMFIYSSLYDQVTPSLMLYQIGKKPSNQLRRMIEIVH